MKGKNKRYLRGLAQTMSPKFQIGKNGINDELINALDIYLEKYELVKISVLDNCPVDKKDLVETLEKNKFIVAGTIGHKIIVYRASKENQTIKFPK